MNLNITQDDIDFALNAPDTDWQAAFRAIARNISKVHLQALANVLKANDPRIIQGATTEPMAQHLDAVGYCPIAFCGHLEGLDLCRDLDGYFYNVCDVDTLGHQPYRAFTDWYDLMPQKRANALLASFVEKLIRE